MPRVCSYLGFLFSVTLVVNASGLIIHMLLYFAHLCIQTLALCHDLNFCLRSLFKKTVATLSRFPGSPTK